MKIRDERVLTDFERWKIANKEEIDAALLQRRKSLFSGLAKLGLVGVLNPVGAKLLIVKR